jgi:hypothetical protein
MRNLQCDSRGQGSMLPSVGVQGTSPARGFQGPATRALGGVWASHAHKGFPEAFAPG